MLMRFSAFVQLRFCALSRCCAFHLCFLLFYNVAPLRFFMLLRFSDGPFHAVALFTTFSCCCAFALCLCMMLRFPAVFNAVALVRNVALFGVQCERAQARMHTRHRYMKRDV